MPVAGDDGLCLGFNGAFQDAVVRGISQNRQALVRLQYRCNGGHIANCRRHPFSIPFELPLKFSGQLGEDGHGGEKLYTSLHGLLVVGFASAPWSDEREM
jgi:hypothetical protein